MNKKAFTLVELLVVIAIIGLLASISIISLNSARAKARDARRVADIKQVTTALELFFNDAGRYPTDQEWSSGSLSYNNQTYLSTIPSAPNPPDGTCDTGTNQFSYTQDNNGESYTITFCTGGNIAALSAGDLCANPGGISACSGGGCTLDCTGKNCGDDGCGGSCGTCTGQDTCISGTCTCQADCAGKNCGDDGCGGSCGTCTGNDVCTSGTCTAPPFACGDQVTITTLLGHTCNTGAPDYDTCTYDTVTIGTQCWFAKNFNVGTMVDRMGNQDNNTILEKYCVNNDASICSVRGGLYQWNEAMQYSITEGAQGICPSGWHIPSDAEQNTLDQFLSDTTCDANRNSGDCANAGAKLQVGGTSHFEGVWAGGRYLNGATDYYTTALMLWSSTISGSNAWIRWLYTGDSIVGRRQDGQAYGETVRCLQD